MTVCIAALCEHSSEVVLVADRMITSGLAIEFEHPLSRKITHLSDNCLTLTAGNALAYTELFNAVLFVTQNRVFTAVEEFVEVIKTSYQNLRRKQIEERVLKPLAFDSFEDFYSTIAHARLPDPLVYDIASRIDGHDYELQILVGGVTNQIAHIYAIDDPGTSHCFDSIGFHVIGSGLNLALSTLIANGCHADLSMAEVVARTIDAKVTAENAPGVGRKTDVFVVSHDGVSHVPDENMGCLKNYCKRWKNGDILCLDKVAQLVRESLHTEKTGFFKRTIPSIIKPANGNDGYESQKEDTAAILNNSNGVVASNETTPQNSPGKGEAQSESATLQVDNNESKGEDTLTAGAGIEPAPG